MKKINWKSLISLGVSIACPALSGILQQKGIPLTVSPGAIGILVGINIVALLPLIQAGAALFGGFMANGVQHVSVGDIRTNILGVLGALLPIAVSTLAIFGWVIDPALQVAMAGFIAKLVTLFSETPSGD